ncbi:MAG: hypothetical protein RLO52_31435 [Sandaracinaceae bacterium]|nr:hypothetical protein [Myxococcales bacterium]
MATPLSLPGAKATLILSLSMTVLGVAGVAIGYGELTGGAMALEAPPGASEAAREAAARLEEGLRGDPIGHALGAANLVVSGLLVLASFMLTLRRKTALWWAGQAVAANALFAIAKPVARCATLLPFAAELVALQDDPTLTTFPAETVTAMMQGALAGWFVLEALILLAIYFILFRLSRREAVRAFVTREAPE